MQKSREDLLRQFSSADGQNPLADFKQGTLAVLKQADERQNQSMHQLLGKLAEVQRELQALRDEREKLEEVAAERERGTAKGRDFEELVAEALDEIAVAQGDDCDAVGDVPGGTGGKPATSSWRSRPAAGRPAGGSCWRSRTAGSRKPAALRELDGALQDATPTTRCSSCRRGRGAREDAAAARVQRRQADRRVGRRGGGHARARARVLARTVARADGRRPRATGSTPARSATQSSGRSGRCRACARSRARSRARRRQIDERDDAHRHDERRACASGLLRSTSWSARRGRTKTPRRPRSRLS